MILVEVAPVLVAAYFFFFFNDTATTEIYTLSLHDALPISGFLHRLGVEPDAGELYEMFSIRTGQDRKSTRLNSSHVKISYAVFCLKKKKSRGGTHRRSPGIRWSLFRFQAY